MDILLSTGSNDKPRNPTQKKTTSSAKGNSAPVDSRLYPAVVKLLDTVLQSLTQMRTLSLVDDNADLSSTVEARTSFTNARRCVYLAQCYGAVKKYAEALTLLQHATIHLRETGSSLSLSESDPINGSVLPFFSLKTEDIKELESTIATDGTQYKRDWFAYNGGSVKADPATYKKPLFFNIALNYVELDMDRLQQRAGKQPVPPPVAAPSSSRPTKKVEPVPEKKQLPKAKAEEHVEPIAEPHLQQQPARGGISSLLGGWWSKSS